MINPSLEDLLLRHDGRGISRLQPYLPADNVHQTASFILQHPGDVIITTGFYVKGIAETDGPPGALALAKGLDQLGNRVHMVTDCYCTPLFSAEEMRAFNLIEFPITDEGRSQSIAQGLLKEIQPSLIIAIERCGQTRSGHYRNMYAVDLTPYTARIDYLFLGQENTVGIGDGGNEIGMGMLYNQIAQIPDLIAEPTTTATKHLLISTVSNWAAYALLAELSFLSGQDLLPTVEEQRGVLIEMVTRGSYDGITGLQEPKVDGFDETVNDGMLAAIHGYLEEKKREENR